MPGGRLAPLGQQPAVQPRREHLQHLVQPLAAPVGRCLRQFKIFSAKQLEVVYNTLQLCAQLGTLHRRHVVATTVLAR